MFIHRSAAIKLFMRYFDSTKKSMNLLSIHEDVERYRVNSQWIRDAMSHGDNLIIVAYTYKNNISQWLRYQKPITKVLISSVWFGSLWLGLVQFEQSGWLFIQCALLGKWIIAYFALIESSFSLLLLRLIDKDLWKFSTFIHRQGNRIHISISESVLHFETFKKNVIKSLNCFHSWWKQMEMFRLVVNFKGFNSFSTIGFYFDFVRMQLNVLYYLHFSKTTFGVCIQVCRWSRFWVCEWQMTARKKRLEKQFSVQICSHEVPFGTCVQFLFERRGWAHSKDPNNKHFSNRSSSIKKGIEKHCDQKHETREGVSCQRK